MKLLTVGDSFTYGEELVDINNAWPYLLGKQINYEVTNLGSPGCSNARMIRNVIENADKHDLIIIAWSHFARLEVSDENGTYDLWPGGSGVFFTGELKYRKELINYVNRHHNDEYLYNQYTTNIVLVQKYLESKGKRYIMMDTFGNHQDKQRQSNGLISQVNDQYYIGWPTESMMEWTYKTPQGPAGHFLEEGHQKVAEKINEYIRNIGWVS